MSTERLFQALIESTNEAADDTLLEALRLGTAAEQSAVLSALFRRKTTHGLIGVIGQYEALPETIQTMIVEQIHLLHHALREAARGSRVPTRLAALKLIALARQGKLAYVLSENLHEPDPAVSKGAVDALVGLSRWIAIETKALQLDRMSAEGEDGQPGEAATVYAQLMAQRPEIEQAVARAVDGHRGKHGAELLRAALLLADWPLSRTLAILNTAKHGAQGTMLRKLQQPPESEHVDAFLQGTCHGGLRSHLNAVFGHINEAPVLDGLLRRTHWLKELTLSVAMHSVLRGCWWEEAELARDLTRRTPVDAARIANWLVTSGLSDSAIDDRLAQLGKHAATDLPARLHLLRIACSRRAGAGTAFLKNCLADPDERIVRMAARELVRRKVPDLDGTLLPMMASAPASVRRVIGRTVGKSGFEQYWNNFDRLEKPRRQQAGKLILKLLPDASQRLSRRLGATQPEDRLKAMQVVQELSLVESMRDRVLSLCSDPNPRLRSKAVSILGEVQSIEPDTLVESLLNDADPRVRANMIEALEPKQQTNFVLLLVQRARTGTNRERANAIKVLHRLRMNVFDEALGAMLDDPRPEHRISGMWALRQTGLWSRLPQLAQLARADGNLRVRRYALAVLKTISDSVKAQRQKANGKAA